MTLTSTVASGSSPTPVNPNRKALPPGERTFCRPAPHASRRPTISACDGDASKSGPCRKVPVSIVGQRMAVEVEDHRRIRQARATSRRAIRCWARRPFDTGVWSTDGDPETQLAKATCASSCSASGSRAVASGRSASPAAAAGLLIKDNDAWADGTMRTLLTGVSEPSNAGSRTAVRSAERGAATPSPRAPRKRDWAGAASRWPVRASDVAGQAVRAQLAKPAAPHRAVTTGGMR